MSNTADGHDAKYADTLVLGNQMLHVPGYVVSTVAQMTSITTMKTGMDCLVTATNTVYRYNAGWQLIGPTTAGTFVTSVSGTAPIVSSGGSTPAISISQATASTTGSVPTPPNDSTKVLLGNATWGNVPSIRSEVFVTGGNGRGSTNNVIRIFTNIRINTGSDITYATNATNGDTFTINTNGIYAITYCEISNTGVDYGISKNSNQLTTGIVSITEANVVSIGSETTGKGAVVPSVLNLLANDVIRAHSNSSTVPDGTSANSVSFRIVKIGN